MESKRVKLDPSFVFAKASGKLLVQPLDATVRDTVVLLPNGQMFKTEL